MVIYLGVIAKLKGFITKDFVTQANRLVYHVGIPAMIFSVISKSDIKTQINPKVILICLATIFLAGLVAWLVAVTIKVKSRSKGSFIHVSFHGNLGYIAFAVTFYYLGDSGLTTAAILAGMIMILQNIMAVVVLTYYAKNQADKIGLEYFFKKTMANPVILAALIGITFSNFSIHVPIYIDRALDILKGMALPTALLIIGASLDFKRLKLRFMDVIITSVIKVVLAPAIGLFLFKFFSVSSPESILPGLIVIAAPSATVTYIMAGEMGGDPNFAAAAISISTLLSSITYIFWLGLV